MSLEDLVQLQQPPGTAISLSISKQGDIFAGWSDGSIMTLPRGSSALSVYVNGGAPPPSTALKWRTPRSEFTFANPRAIDAWGASGAQYVGDGTLNHIFEISSNSVTVVAGTGASGCKDGNGLTEATFDSIRSISVLPSHIAVLSNSIHGFSIRFIDRATNRVTTLPNFPNIRSAFYLLNASLTPSSDVIGMVEAGFPLLTHYLPTPGSTMKKERSQCVRLFKGPGSTIEVRRTLYGSFISSCLDGSPLKTQKIDANLLQSVFPVYCPRSDSLFAVSSGKVGFYRNFLGRKDSVSIEFDNASNLLEPSGLKPDLVLTHNASKTTLKLFRSLIDRRMMPPTPSPSSILQNLIPTSTLPISIIQRFLEYIYFKPLGGADSSQLVALAWMYKKVYGKEDPIILKALQAQLDHETDSVAHNLLISAWMDTSGPFELDETSLVVAMILQKVQKNRSLFKPAFDAAMAKQAANLHTILSRMTSLLILVSGPSLDSTLPESEPIDASHFKLYDVTASTSWNLELYSTNFVIVNPSHKTISVCGWLLYIHWPWFKRLVDSGLQESKTRIITLPEESITPRGLTCLLDTLQLGHQIVGYLSLEDSVSILTHASQYDLIGLDGAVLPRVAPLIEACEAMVFPPLTTTNCWNQLGLAHSVGSSKYPAILEFILKTTNKIAFDELAHLPEAVVLDLFRKVQIK